MAVEIKVANIAYGDDEKGGPWAVVTFQVAARRESGGDTSRFTFEIGVKDDGDPSATVQRAKIAMHMLALDMAEASAG